MEYQTTAEISKIWKISQRRVAILCKEGRINGAVLKGRVWLIPNGSPKPEDDRMKKTDNQKGGK